MAHDLLDEGWWNIGVIDDIEVLWRVQWESSSSASASTITRAVGSNVANGEESPDRV